MQVFYTRDKTLMQSIRQRHPILLYDAEAQQVHGVYQRTLDAQLLMQDLTSPPGPQGYQVSQAASVMLTGLRAGCAWQIEVEIVGVNTAQAATQGQNPLQLVDLE